MATYNKHIKLKEPLAIGGDAVYPITTADQIYLADGTKLEVDGKIQGGGGDVSFEPDGESEGVPVSVNADTLGGRPAEDYELKTDHKWKKLGDYVGTAVADISGIVANGADELLAVVWTTARFVSISIAVAALSDSANHWMCGWSGSSTASAQFAQVDASKTNVSINAVWEGGTQKTASSTLQLFYR